MSKSKTRLEIWKGSEKVGFCTMLNFQYVYCYNTVEVTEWVDLKAALSREQVPREPCNVENCK